MKIDFDESDRAPYLKPESVLALMRVAKKMQRFIERLDGVPGQRAPTGTAASADEG